MTSWIDRLADKLPETSDVGDSGYQWIDGDTLKHKETGESIRLSGFDTAETGKGVYAMEGMEDVKPPDAAGPTSFKEMANLANTKGFTEVLKGDSKGAYGRVIGDLKNPETGELWSDYVIENGLQGLNQYSSDTDVRKAVSGMRDRAEDMSGGDQDVRAVRQAIADANFQGRDVVKTRAMSVGDYARNPEMYSGVAALDYGTNLDGSAKNQWSVSLDNALIGMSSSFHGLKQLIGDATGLEGMATQAEIDKNMAEFRIQLNPTTTVDISDINGISDAVDWAGNMTAMSLPFMATSMLAGAAGTLASPIVGTAGAIAIATLGPSALMAGQVYNEQEVKNVPAAVVAGIAQGTLERLGLVSIGAVSKIGNKPLSSFLEGASKQLAKQDGIALSVARNRVADASRREIAGFMKDSAEYAASHLTARNLSRDIATRGAKAFGVESTTEMAQETIAQIGANMEKENFDIFKEGEFQKEFLNRLANAGAGGGTVGFGIGAGSGVVNAGGWADVKWKLSEADKHMTPADLHDLENKDQRTHEEVFDDIDTTDVEPDLLPLRIDEHKTRMEDRSTKEKVLTSPSTAFDAFFSGAGKNMYEYTTGLGMKYPSLLRLANSFLDPLQKSFSGRNYEQFIMHTKSKYDQLVNVNDTSKGYGGHYNDQKALDAFNKDFYKVSDKLIKHNERNRNVDKPTAFDWSTLTAEQQSKIKPLVEQLQSLSDLMRKEQNAAWNGKGMEVEEKFKKLDLYLLKFKAMDKQAVVRDKNEFVKSLMNAYGYSNKIATELTNKLIDTDGATDVSADEDVFSMVTKGLHPAASKNRSIAMSEVPELSKFFHQDLTRNVQEAKKSAARFVSYNKYVGRGGRKLEALLQKAAEEGASQDEINGVANAVNNIIQAQSGNYKRPKEGTQAAKALAVSKNFSLLTMFVGLPMSAISSTPELAVTLKALNSKQLLGPNGLKHMGKEVGRTLYNAVMMMGVESWTGHETINNSKTAKQLHDLGFGSRETGAATVTGAEEVSDMKRVWVDRFFKYNGTQGITNLTRAIRVGSGMDFISDHFEVLLSHRAAGTDNILTNEQRESRSQLRNLGLAVDRYMDLYNTDGTLRNLTAEQEAFLKDQHDTALYNWVNDAVVLPGAANRPLFYQDPRFALLTQFNGFISTFTSHHIPKLWGEYVKRGSPAMKYNAFAVMMTMVVLGYASQYLKDLIKFGEETPYLDEKNKYRRAVNSSGLLGTAERFMNIAKPLYPQRNEGPIGWAVETALGEVPSVGPLSRIAKAGDALWEGDYETAKYNALRATPVIAPMTTLARELSGR
jgi:hypothetical protein